MDLKKTRKIPLSAIALDITGTVLLVLGIIGLMQIEAPFLHFINGEPRQAWTLVIFGAVFMIAATMLIIGTLLAGRTSEEAPPVVDRRER